MWPSPSCICSLLHPEGALYLQCTIRQFLWAAEWLHCGLAGCWNFSQGCCQGADEVAVTSSWPGEDGHPGLLMAVEVRIG